MKEGYYIYNNEAIACGTIILVLQEIVKLDIPKLCLVLPFLLDEKTVSLLEKNMDNEMSMNDIISNNPNCFSSFNRRFIALLPVLINSITMLYDAKMVKLSHKEIKYSYTNIVFKDCGKRFYRISKVSSFFAEILNNTQTKELYKALKIQL